MNFFNLKLSPNLLSLIFFALVMQTACGEHREPKVLNDNNATFYVDPVSVKGTLQTVDGANVYGKQYKQLLSVEVCLKDNAGTNSVHGLRFDIAIQELSIQKKSDLRGCLQWQELIEYNPNSEARLLFLSRRIVGQELHKGEVPVVFSVNPHSGSFQFMERGSQSTLSQQDVHQITHSVPDTKALQKLNYVYDIYLKVNDSIEALAQNGSQAPQVDVLSFNLEYQEIAYDELKIDSLLNLSFPYKYKTSFNLDLVRQDLGGLKVERIKKGNFHFHLVFLTDTASIENPKSEDVVAQVEFIANPRGESGLIDVPITLNFKNVAALQSRMRLLFTVTSLDEPKLFFDGTYEGKVNNITANANLQVVLSPNQVSAKKLYLANQHLGVQRQAAKQLSVDSVLQHEGFSKAQANDSVINIQVPGASRILQPNVARKLDLNHLVSTWTEQRQATLVEQQNICLFYFQKKSTDPRLLDLCMYNPGSVLGAEIREFVESVDEKPLSLAFGRVELLKVLSAFEVSQQKHTKKGYAFRSSVGAYFGLNFNPKAGLNFAQWFGLGQGNEGAANSLGLDLNLSVGGKGFYAHEYESIDQHKKVVNVVSTESLSVQPLVVTFAGEIKKCLLISPRIDVAKKYKMNSQDLPSVYHCSQQHERTERTEFYFLMNHHRISESNALADAYSSAVNELRLLVRGQKVYEFFKMVLTQDKQAIKIPLVKSTAVAKKSDPVAMSQSFLMTQEAPLLLSNVRMLVVPQKK